MNHLFLAIILSFFFFLSTSTTVYALPPAELRGRSYRLLQAKSAPTAADGFNNSSDSISDLDKSTPRLGRAERFQAVQDRKRVVSQTRRSRDVKMVEMVERADSETMLSHSGSSGGPNLNQVHDATPLNPTTVTPVPPPTTPSTTTPSRNESSSTAVKHSQSDSDSDSEKPLTGSSGSKSKSVHGQSKSSKTKKSNSKGKGQRHSSARKRMTKGSKRRM